MNRSNAILMAAGLGSRMLPLTELTPKPLLKVGNTTLIETVINAFPPDMIENFYIVTGYLGEQFLPIQKKYDNVKLINNPDYNVANNISSIFYAKDILRLGKCFICETDLYITDSSFLQKLPTESCYYGKYMAGDFNDWGFDISNDSYIIRIKKEGCSNTYAMTGISYFSEKDSYMLAEFIEKAYSNKNYKKKFWDEIVDDNLDIPMLKIRKIKEDQIIELDTEEELVNVRNRFV